MDTRASEQAVVCIPFKDDDEDGSSRSQGVPEGQDCTLKEPYRKSWTKCLERIQQITRKLLDPYASQIVEYIEDNSALPGLPRPELPVITVTNPVFRGTFLYDVTGRLGVPSVHLHPSDCPNTVTGMRGIVSGFIEGDPDVTRPKHKPSMSLTNYDIRLLAAWYQYYKNVNDDAEQLLVVLHDFEAFMPSVMQDIFYICSKHVPELPLVFVLSMSSPVPSYLNVAYPRSTLARLRVRTLTMPGGVSVLNRILLGTFFSIDFQPDLVLGPITLQYLCDYYTRHDATLDSFITNLQLVHMKHFSIEPLTGLLHSTPSKSALAQPDWANVADGLLTRLTPISRKLSTEERDEQWNSLTPSALPGLINSHRSQFYSRAKDVVVAFNLMHLIEDFLRIEGLRGLGWDTEAGLSDILIEVLQNNVRKDVEHFGLIVKKLSEGPLGRLRPLICDFLVELPDMGAEVNEISRTDTVSLAEWITTFIKSRLASIEDENPLWEIWYTGFTPFPSELVNPSLRASIMAGLLRPADFVENPDDEDEEDGEDEEEGMWKLPDTSILFKRYLDSGRMINVYDWFESFQAVLEQQKEELSKTSSSAEKRRGKKKAGAKAKGKGKEKQVAEGRREWKLEVQARFMRALHELDYLGFIKHTKRKADHVIRTVFDLAE
ncbi:origin recognition complex subunit 3 N-terminus-domain-containing protein [Coprinopsis sp. MPI-PUGE-AT-0042]|nr:origin recognition complex subunit 3 N-terminus-domain-containing protein [Coprinopsis sp. MPI-PUGE-AT-0042]